MKRIGTSIARFGPGTRGPALFAARLLPVALLVLLWTCPALAQPITIRHPTSQAVTGFREPASDPFSMTRVVLALGAVVSLIFAIKWGARRFMIGGVANGHSRAVQVISRTIISPKQQFMLVKVGRRLVLVANTGAGMNPICEIRDEQEVAELLGQVSAEQGDSVSRAFGSMFQREEEKFTSSGDDDVNEATPNVDAAPEIDANRTELSGLMEKVRLVSKQFKRPS